MPSCFYTRIFGEGKHIRSVGIVGIWTSGTEDGTADVIIAGEHLHVYGGCGEWL